MDKKQNQVLSETVYQQVLDLIMTKRIQCGERISEERIAQMLGISRTPIREAMRRLSNEGIVNIYPKRYAEVVTIDETFIKDLGTVRITMDTLAALLAIDHGSNNDFLELKDIADKCMAAAQRGDINERIRLDSSFHTQLTEISGNPILVKMQKELYLKVSLVQVIKYKDIEDSVKRVEGHFAIIDALLKRDTRAVIKSIQDHLGAFYALDSIPKTFPIIVE